MAGEKLWVCEHCLRAIESREGTQTTLRHEVNEDDDSVPKCGWCGEGSYDVLYELV